jgi:hypothetical protein
MNERMAELVGKAWEEADKEVSEKDWHTWVHDEIFQAKLVELVVKECANVCYLNIIGMVGTHASAHNSAIDACAKQIKTHFGVEDK